jgi:hypothetical protein
VIGTGSGEFYYEGVYGGTFSWEISA